MDAEIPSVFFETYRKSRKDHKCCECRRAIKIGERYHFAKGCWDGKWDEFKTCEQCDDLRRRLRDGYELAPFGYLGEWAQDRDIEFPVKE